MVYEALESVVGQSRCGELALKPLNMNFWVVLGTSRYVPVANLHA